MPVGRASKSVNKGIVGAMDNAWFDSPVMSRNHAELTLNMEDKVSTGIRRVLSISGLTRLQSVAVVDIGSMHGTFLNNDMLKQHEPTILNDCDVLVFGAQVTRGTETISACAFKVNLEFVPYRYAPYDSFIMSWLLITS